jgi:hypothetical protein
MCNVNYEPLNLLGGWVVNFFSEVLHFSLLFPGLLQNSKTHSSNFVNTGPPKPEIQANIALSSTKVRTLPNLLPISTLLPYTPLLPPSLSPKGRTHCSFLETLGLDEAEDSTLELLPAQSYEVAASRRA